MGDYPATAYLKGWQIERTRHRSPINFAVNLLGGIIAYCLMNNKPTLPLMRLTRIDVRIQISHFLFLSRPLLLGRNQKFKNGSRQPCWARSYFFNASEA